MEVVAEGVETGAQGDVLKAIGCDRAQGLHFGPPGNAALVEERMVRTA
jgi:EAL domain-containing protein (putative c-di-GMP-specific phosphodiesterase class I)